MLIRDFDRPWPHSVITSVFTQEDYLTILNYSYKVLPDIDISRFHSNGFINKGCSSKMAEELRKEEPDVTRICETIFARALKHIGMRYHPDHFQIQWDLMPPDYTYGIHTDTNAKTASMIVYLGEVGRGTVLHERKDSEPAKEIPFVTNSALLFKRSGQSFHSIDMRGITSLRRTLNMIYVNDDINLYHYTEVDKSPLGKL